MQFDLFLVHESMIPDQLIVITKAYKCCEIPFYITIGPKQADKDKAISRSMTNGHGDVDCINRRWTDGICSSNSWVTSVYKYLPISILVVNIQLFGRPN